MTSLTGAVLGGVGSAALNAVIGCDSPRGELAGRTLTPMGHWSSTLLWVATAVSVAACALAALMFVLPFFMALSSVLIPAFSVTFFALGAACAIGAYFISKFVPEHVFEENVARFQETIGEYQQRIVALQSESLQLQTHVDELSRVNEEAKIATARLDASNKELLSAIAKFGDGSVDLGSKNVQLEAEVSRLKDLLGESGLEKQSLQALNVQLGDHVSEMEEQLSRAKKSLEDFSKEVLDLKATKDSLIAQVAALNEALSGGERVQKQTAEESQLLKRELEGILARLRDAERTMNELATQKDSLEQKAHSLELTNDALRENIARLNVASVSLQASFEKVSSALKSIGKSSGELDHDGDQISDLVVSGAKVLQSGEAQSKMILAQIEQFMTTVKDQQSLVQSLLTVKDDLERLRLAKDAVDAEVAHLKDRVAELQQENLALSATLAQLKKASEEHQSENVRTEALLKQFQAASELFARRVSGV